jgi:hypothetical protein
MKISPVKKKPQPLEGMRLSQITIYVEDEDSKNDYTVI